MSFQLNDKVVCVDDRQTGRSGFTTADYTFDNGMVVRGEVYVICGFVDNTQFGHGTGLLLTGKSFRANSGMQRCPGWNPLRFSLFSSAANTAVTTKRDGSKFKVAAI